MTTSALPTPPKPRTASRAPRAPRARRPRPTAAGSPWRAAWKRVRPVLFWAHLAVGVTVGAVVLVMSVTGVLLTYQRQLTEWSASANAVAPPAPGVARLPLDSVLARAVAAAPAGARPTALTVRADPRAAVAVSVGPRQSVYVDPYTGATRQASPWLRALFMDAERWHRSLATGESLRDEVGVTVTGACNLAFLFLILSGLLLWWPRRWSWAAFRAVLLFQRRANGRQRDWNWHHVLGIWSAPALAAVVFSAVFISYQWPQRLVQRLTGSPAPAETPRAETPRSEGARAEGARGGERGAREAAPRAALDTLWARAAGALPGWYSVQLRLPQRPGDARVTATVSATSAMRPDRRVQVTLDARTGAVRERQGYGDMDTARRFRSWMRGLHTGEVAGLAGQTIAGLASAAAVVLVYTGLALSWRRLRSAVARRARGAERHAVDAAAG